jgi:hypothetical protein
MKGRKSHGKGKIIARGKRGLARQKRATKGLPAIPEKLESFFFIDKKGNLKNRAIFTNLTLGKPVIGEAKNLQTRVTPTVKAYASQFKPAKKGWKGKRDMVQQIVDKIARIKMEKVKPSHAELLYSKRTAEDILASGKIPALFPAGLKRPAWGCSDQVTALIAVLRAKRIQAEYVRTVYGWWDPNRATLNHPHSVAFIHLGNRMYIADPFLLSQGEAHPSNPLLRQVGEEVRARIGHLRHQGKWWPGRDAWGLGIRNIWEYNRYILHSEYRNDKKKFKEFLETMEKKEKG